MGARVHVGVFVYVYVWVCVCVSYLCAYFFHGLVIAPVVRFCIVRVTMESEEKRLRIHLRIPCIDVCAIANVFFRCMRN